MNVEKVTPKSLESEKAAEYALAVCEEGLGKSGVKTKNLGGGSFGTAVGVTVLGAVIIYAFQALAKSNLPYIADFISDIIDIIEKTRK